MKNILIVFAKAPILGRVKTRLAPPLSYRQSYVLHRAFIKDTLKRITRLKDIKPCLGYYPKGYKHKFKGLLPPGMELFCQQGKNLGQRMQNALKRYLVQNGKVVIIGADIPGLPLGYIREAFNQLDEHEVVLGPAADGGYYLVGSKLIPPEIFTEIAWGTDKVYEQTCARLNHSGYKYSNISPWFDVDRPQDLSRLKQLLEQNPQILPATRKVMASFPVAACPISVQNKVLYR